MIKSMATMVPLQWGRNLSVAEGGAGVADGPKAGMASMGPQPFGCGRPLAARAGQQANARLQWGRNLSVAEGSLDTRVITDTVGFNGAATFRLRKGAARRHVGRGKNASMGPQPFGCGRLLPRLPPPPRRTASMGPQPFGCGRRVCRGATSCGYGFNGAATFRLRKACARGGNGKHTEPASMGPQPFGCGRIVLHE